jgi:hypothetical protein
MKTVQEIREFIIDLYMESKKNLNKKLKIKNLSQEDAVRITLSYIMNFIDEEEITNE